MKIIGDEIILRGQTVGYLLPSRETSLRGDAIDWLLSGPKQDTSGHEEACRIEWAEGYDQGFADGERSNTEAVRLGAALKETQDMYGALLKSTQDKSIPLGNWVSTRLGTEKWAVAARLTEKLRYRGIEKVIPQNRFTILKEQWKEDPTIAGAMRL
jgi:hypothetical protein